MSVTQQKSDLRQKIHAEIEQYLVKHPSAAHNVAIGAVHKLSSMMTLRELQEWYAKLLAKTEEAQP